MCKQRIICIVGTDTDAGKTSITAGMLRAAQNLGIPARAVKPVQTGCNTDEQGRLVAPDITPYKEANPAAPSVSYFNLKDPCSPHLAAQREGVELSLSDLISAIGIDNGTAPAFSFQEDGRNNTSLTLIEGAGGLMVPINESQTMLDLFERIGAPVLLAVPNRLGAINHALLSIEMLRTHKIEILGFILSSTAPDPGDNELEHAIKQDNRDTISRMSGLNCLTSIPFTPELSSPDSATRSRGWESVGKLLEPALSRFMQEEPHNVASKNEENMDWLLASSERLEFDRNHIWHPYTSALHPLNALEVSSTSGAHIYLTGGTKLVDGMSSWWSAIMGYNHPHIMQAMHAQIERMPHVMFGGLTHEPAVELARSLLSMVPKELEHVFFADSGSVSVEVAIKMAVQYQQATGNPQKSSIFTVRGGYHGDTLGAMSVCDPQTGMHSLFAGILPQQIFAPRPSCRVNEAWRDEYMEPIRELFIANSAKIAAIIIEPVVQGAGGMWFYHPNYLKGLKALCDEYGALLIFDEIATGFGRTGTMFACEQAELSPDIMCVGKAMTGGSISLAATLASKKVAEGVSNNGGVLMHGPTYMANPLACSAALAALKLLQNGQWKVYVDRIEALLRTGLARCEGLEGVKDVRVLGAIGVVEMKEPVDVEALQTYFVREHGVWIRPFASLIYIMPPYIIPEDELQRVTHAIYCAIKDKKWV